MIEPYYSEAGIVIYHGDCAEIASLLGRFDLLCTDPPYGIGEARGRDRGRVKRGALRTDGHRAASVRDYGSSDWDDSPASQDLIDRVRSLAEWQCVFGGNYYSLPPSSCWLVWDKETVGNSFADCELAWTNYTSAVRLKRHLWNGMCRAGLEPRYHPTQKPLAVMSWAIGLCPERPSTVLDPFMGSGTTLVACKNLGIRAVGIEREKKYVDIAVRRLAQQTLPLLGASP